MSTSSPTATQPKVKQGDARWFFGQLAIMRATAAETDGEYTIIEIVSPPGLAVPLYVHHNEDEGFLIVEGEVTLFVGDERIEAKAGEFYLGPKDVPHRYEIGPNGARMLWVCTPSGFENLVTAASVPAEAMTIPPAHVTPPEDVTERIAPYGAEILA